MPLIRLKKATPGNIVLIDFSSKHEVGKSSEKRVSPFRQQLAFATGKRFAGAMYKRDVLFNLKLTWNRTMQWLSYCKTFYILWCPHTVISGIWVGMYVYIPCTTYTHQNKSCSKLNQRCGPKLTFGIYDNTTKTHLKFGKLW